MSRSLSWCTIWLMIVVVNITDVIGDVTPHVELVVVGAVPAAIHCKSRPIVQDGIVIRCSRQQRNAEKSEWSERLGPFCCFRKSPEAYVAQ